MVAAATAWSGLADELQSAAASYSAVIATLTSGPWIGPSSQAMAAAATPYLTWLDGLAAQATQTAVQAMAAASAYEAAFASHVPPAEITANRGQLVSLAASNIVGQNSAAIAAIEAQYSEMWAQDAIAMDSYAAASAAASQLTPFSEPPQIVDAMGLASHGPLSELLSVLAKLSTDYTATITALLNALFGPAGASTFTALYSAVKVPLGFTTQFNSIALLINFPASQFLKFGPHSATALDALPKDALGSGLAAPHWRRGSLTGMAAADSVAQLGRGTLVGSLTVPPAWTANTPAIRTVAAALSAAGPEAVPAAALGQGDLLSSMSLAGMAGSGLGAGSPDALARTGAKSRLTPVADLKALKTPEALQRLVAQISDKPGSVQHHTVEREGLDDLLEQLSKKPGIHAVHLASDKPRVLPSDGKLG